MKAALGGKAFHLPWRAFRRTDRGRQSAPGKAECLPSKGSSFTKSISLVGAIAALALAVTVQGESGAPFWAIAGSFLNESAAQSAAQDVARKIAMSPTILVATTPTGPMHRVALGPWPSSADALEAIRQLQEAGYTDAWKLSGEGNASKLGPQDVNDASISGGENVSDASNLGGEGVSPSQAPQGESASTPIQEQPAAARVVAPSAPIHSTPNPLAFQADIRASTVFGTTDATPSKQKEELSLIAGLRADFEAAKALGLSGFHFTTRIRREGSDALVPGQPKSPSAVRHHLDAYAEAELRQAWVDLSHDDWRFRIGRQSVVWGETKGLKVLDIVNPQSYREFLLASFDGSRTPLWMLNAERQVGQGTLQALLVLEREGHRLPRTVGVFAQAPYADRPRAPGRARYRDLEPGLRYSFARQGWALTLNVLRHRDDFPIWRRTETGERQPFEPRMTTLGTSAAKTYGDYSLRVETTVTGRRHFFATSPTGIHASPEFSSAVGVAWTALPNTQIDIQFFQTSTLDHAPTLARDETEMTVVAIAERTFPNAGLAASLTTHQSLSGQGALIRPRLIWQPNETLSITAFADLFEGPPNTFYGQFHHRDRVGLAVHLRAL